MAEFYRDYGLPDVEYLARAIATQIRGDADLMVPESGYFHAEKVPLWWKYQDDAVKFLTMLRAWDDRHEADR